MTPQQVAPYALLLVLSGAVIFAVVHSPTTPPEPTARAEDNQLRPLIDDPPPGVLPPDHPPIGSNTQMPVAKAADKAVLTWTRPAAWIDVPSSSSMRLATYHVLPMKGDTDETEMSIIVAGGSTDANIDRWVHQFENAGKDTRTTKTVSGFKVTIVDVSGTFAGGGMMPSAPAGPKKGWSLLGAIVETGDSSYFFKMTGPTATVHSADKSFREMIDSIKRQAP